MPFDWFTFLAQIVNFGVLVILLQRVLYRPILRAVHTREQAIAARLEEAAAVAERGADQAAAFAEQQRQLEAARESILAKAQVAAEEQHRHSTRQARDEIARLRRRWRHALQAELRGNRDAIIHRLTTQVTATCRRILSDLANCELDSAVVTELLRQLANPPEEATRDWLTLEPSGGQLICVSATPLEPAVRLQLEQGLSTLASGWQTPGWQASGRKIEVDYRTEPELVLGIELELGNFSVGWTARDMLDDFTAALAEAETELAEPNPQQESGTATPQSEAKP